MISQHELVELLPQALNETNLPLAGKKRGKVRDWYDLPDGQRLIVTTDWTFSHGRDWGSPKIPEEMNLKTILRLSPEAITKPPKSALDEVMESLK